MEKAKAKAIAADILLQAVKENLELNWDEAMKIQLLAQKEVLLEELKRRSKKSNIGLYLINELKGEVKKIEAEISSWPQDDKKLKKLKEACKMRYLARKEVIGNIFPKDS